MSAETMSREDAIAAVKTHLSDPGGRVRLHDLMVEEARRVSETLGKQQRRRDFANRDDAHATLRELETLTANLRAMLFYAAYWGTDLRETGIAQAMSFVVEAGGGRRDDHWTLSRGYPASLMLYTAGLACVAAERYALLADLLRMSFVVGGSEFTASDTLVFAHDLIGSPVMRELFPREATRSRNISEHVFKVLEQESAACVPSPARCFDELETLIALVELNSLGERLSTDSPFHAAGRFVQSHGDSVTTARVVISRMEREAVAWKPVRDGLLAVSKERLDALCVAFNTHLKKLIDHMR